MCFQESFWRIPGRFKAADLRQRAAALEARPAPPSESEASSDEGQGGGGEVLGRLLPMANGESSEEEEGGQETAQERRKKAFRRFLQKKKRKRLEKQVQYTTKSLENFSVDFWYTDGDTRNHGLYLLHAI